MTTPRLLSLGCLATLCLLLSMAQAQAWSTPQNGLEITPAQYNSPDQGYEIYNNGNIDAVQNGPSRPTFFTIDVPYTITQVQNYHYFNYGRPPGYISLRSRDGTRYGPWPAMGEYGQGGVPNAYWNCYPNITIPPGTYRVEDSDPATWSMNAGSDYRGITLIRGMPAY